MKSCPTCKRTFGDEMVFCLVDGAILSPPFDPKATTEVAAGRPTEPAQTVLIDAGSAPTHSFPAAASPTSLTDQPARPGKRRWRLAYLMIPLAVVAGALIVLFSYRASQCPTITMECRTLEDYAVCQVMKPAHSAEIDGTDGGPPLVSFVTILQRPARAFPKAHRISWTTSDGTVAQQHVDDEEVRIDTTGLAGRSITVTATIRGLGFVCSNTASTSFVVPSGK